MMIIIRSRNIRNALSAYRKFRGVTRPDLLEIKRTRVSSTVWDILLSDNTTVRVIIVHAPPGMATEVTEET